MNATTSHPEHRTLSLPDDYDMDDGIATKHEHDSDGKSIDPLPI